MRTPLRHATLSGWDCAAIVVPWTLLAIVLGLFPVVLAVCVERPWRGPETSPPAAPQSATTRPESARREREAIERQQSTRRLRQIQTWIAAGEFGPVNEEEP